MARMPEPEPAVVYLPAHRRGAAAGPAAAAAGNAVHAVLAAMEILDLNELRWRIRTAAMGPGVRAELEAETQRALDHASQWWLCHRPRATDADIARHREGVRALTPRIPAWRPGALSADLLRRSGGPIRRGAPAALAEEVFLLLRRCALLEVLDLAECTGSDAVEVADLYFVLYDQLETRRGGLGHEDGPRSPAAQDDALRTLALDVLTVAGPGGSLPDRISAWEGADRTRAARGRTGLDDAAAVAGHGPTRRVRRLRSVVTPS